MVTPRENILNVFRHEMPDWIPICGHCDPYNQPAREGMDPNLAVALKCVEWDDESTLQFSRYLGLDIMDYTMPPVQVTRQRVNIQVYRDGPDQISIWHTHHGDLREVQRTSEVGTTYLIEHLIKGAGDLPLLAEIFEDEILSPDNLKVQKIKDRQNKIGEDGVLMCFGPGTPLGMMYRVYTQVDTLTYLWADARQALFDLFLVMEKNYRQVFEVTAKTDVDALVGMDDTSTGLISPAMFHKVNIELTNQRADLAHQAGKLYFHHSCGHIRGLLPLYRQTRMDAVHMFTVPPTGDVTLKEGRELLGDQITIIAGIQPLESSIFSTPDHVRADVWNYLSGAPNEQLILNLVAFPHKTICQTRAILDECRKILNSRLWFCSLVESLMDLDTLPSEQQKVFCDAVWKIARLVPSGKVVPYGQIAGYIPCPPGVKEETYKSYRARWAGAAMAASPAGVPWQRVINAQGMISQRRGAESQRRMLEAEGVVFDVKDRIDLAVYGWSGPDLDWIEENGLVPPTAPTLF